MKKVQILLSALSLLFFSTNLLAEDQTTRATIEMNTSADGSATIDNGAYFYVWGHIPGEDVNFTIKRTEFDGGPNTHFALKIGGTNVSYFDIFNEGDLSATIDGKFVHEFFTLIIYDHNRQTGGEWPAQEFEFSINQTEFNKTLLEEDFENGWNGWETYCHWDAEASFALYYNGHGTVGLTSWIANEGTEPWHVHVRKTGIPVVAGQKYYVRMNAITELVDMNKVFTVRVEENGGDYTTYGEKTFVATRNPHIYEFTFESPITDNDAVLCVEMGEIDSPFSSDDPLDLVIDGVKVMTTN